MKNAVCTESGFRILAGAQDAFAGRQNTNMPKLKLILALMSLVAVIIIGMAVYVFANFSNLHLTQGIILVVIGVIALVIVMVTVYLLYKSMTAKK
jgi:hypothetical protein